VARSWFANDMSWTGTRAPPGSVRLSSCAAARHGRRVPNSAGPATAAAPGAEAAAVVKTQALS
jgi:hypothetical protein